MNVEEIIEAALKKSVKEEKAPAKNKARKVSKLSKQKVKRYNLPKSANSEKFEKFIQIFLKQMLLTQRGTSNTILMLTGAPGTGKTSIVNKVISKLLGMHIFTIEASQITTDQFAAIPYIVFNPKTGTREEVTMNFEKGEAESDFTLINAESAIVTRIKKLKILTDDEHLKLINKDKQLKALYTKFEKIIKMVRKSAKTDKSGFSGILFIDEYWRTNYQNILRQILNKQIGVDKIPDDIFIVAASNLDDKNADSLSQINLNQQFAVADFDNDYNQGVDGFFSYLANNYTDVDIETGEDDANKKVDVEIAPEVYNTFKDNITEEDFKNDSPEGRVSPRRMEQIILYVNNNVPCSTQDDADALLAYVKNACTNYLSGETFPIYDKIKNITKKIIAETSPNVNPNSDGLRETEWHKLFDRALESRLELGNTISYPITLQSKPGQGKTSKIAMTAKEKNLGLILIDCSTIDTDATVGLPLPKEEGDTVETVFSEPPLYKLIMSKYDEEIKKLQDAGIKTEDRKYNVILDLGEINRAESNDVFNKLRILLLEKKVGTAEYKLPDDILIISDLNPQDVDTKELPEHFADVLDFIPVSLSITDEEEYLKGMSGYTDIESYLKFKPKKLALEVLRSIYDRLKSDIDFDSNDIKDIHAQPYFWNIDGVNIIYVSPREITFMFQSIIEGVYTSFLLEDWENASAEDNEKFINIAKEATYDAIKDMVKGICIKQQIEQPDVNKFLKIIYEQIKASDIFKNTITIQENEILNNISFSTFIANANYDVESIIKEGGVDFLQQYLTNVGDVNELKNDIGTVFVNAQKNIKIEKMFKFFDKVVDLFAAIDYSSIPSGNAIKDSIRLFFKEQYSSLMDNTDFLIAIADLDEKELDDFGNKVNEF